MLSKLKRKRQIPIKDDFEPTVSLIIAAHNEEQVIAQKIKNSLALDYPGDKLEIIVASDGSLDATNEIVKNYKEKNIKLVSHPRNRGKTIIQNQAAELAHGDILVFSDATGMYETDAIGQLVRHFAHKEVGCVIGTVCDSTSQVSSITAANYAYFAYENSLRKLESDIGILAVGTGSIFAVRRSLYQPLPSYVSDDFVTPMNIVEKGYRVIYEPGAISLDEISDNIRGKFTQKVRIVTLDLPGFFCKHALINPFRFPLVAWSLISHKLMRWLVPVWLVLLIFANFFLLGIPFYRLTLLVQIVFYLLAIIGWRMQVMGKKIKLFYIPFYFCLLNAAALKGLVNFLSGVRIESWESER